MKQEQQEEAPGRGEPWKTRGSRAVDRSDQRKAGWWATVVSGFSRAISVGNRESLASLYRLRLHRDAGGEMGKTLSFWRLDCMKENQSHCSGHFHRASALLRFIGSCPVCIGCSLTCKLLPWPQWVSYSDVSVSVVFCTPPFTWRFFLLFEFWKKQRRALISTCCHLGTLSPKALVATVKEAIIFSRDFSILSIKLL